MYVMKINLPVILLRNMLLLPNNDIRLEFENDESKNILEVASLFHEDKLLVVSSENPLEEVPDLEGLPQVGVIAHIDDQMELPNGKIRVVIHGEERVHIVDYLNINHTQEVLEAIVVKEKESSISREHQMILIDKMVRELKRCMKKIPYISNSLMTLIEKEKRLDVVTDLIASHLPIAISRMDLYLNEFDSKKRSEMILEDIYKQEHVFEIEKELDSRVHKVVDQNQREYLLKERLKAIQEELGEKEYSVQEIEKWKEKIEQTQLPMRVKERLEMEMRRYQSLTPMSPEMNILHTYIDWLLDLPWTQNKSEWKDFHQVKQTLDASHAGLEKVKERMIEFLAVRKFSKRAHSPIICLVGPPGVGKTSLAFSIARAMHREFVKTSVGGVSDEAEIIGHRRTYLGAMPGRILQAMKKAKTNNPVFLIDEIDKMTQGVHGDPASCFLEILDPEQNRYFRDNYIEVEYDLSKVLFILTANDVSEIPLPLQDRLEIISLDGYTEYEKLDIAKKHLLPKLCRSHGLKPSRVVLEDADILYIIRHYTMEAGVRELERQLEKMLRKIVKEIVVDFKQQSCYVLRKKEIITYLGKEKYQPTVLEKPLPGVVNGLAYTPYGGDTLSIEVNYYKGNGSLVLTGSLGEVMKESATLALSYMRSHAELFGMDAKLFTENDIHIHVPAGAIPKDGPSAGITLVTALYSAFSKHEIGNEIAMTGEMTLQGRVLPVGGLKEKSLGAARHGIKKIFIPYDNLKDLEEIPVEVKKEIEYIPVKQYSEILSYLRGER